ncbi:MAG TPA: Ig-like domain-containing protein [Kofleriaceae bacterium]|nr:Ig-like domain-containing protein [Kofleriaceae bacterium]
MRARSLVVLTVLSGTACREPAAPADEGALDAGATTDGGSSADATAAHPGVRVVDPADDATDVALGVKIEITFMERMAPASITPATFSLTRDGAPVAGRIEYDEYPRQARFVPDAPLARSAVYMATVAPTLQTENGVPFGRAFTWSFTTAAHGWDDITLLDGHASRGLFAAATGPAGETHLLWNTGEYPTSPLWTRHRDAAGAWQPPERFGSPGSGFWWPQLLVGDGGHVVAVRETSDDGDDASIWVSRYDGASGWGPPSEATHRDAPLGGSPTVTVDASGAVTVLWSEDNPGHDEEVAYRWVRRQAANGVWDAPESFDAIARNADPTLAASTLSLVAVGDRTELYWGLAGNTSNSFWSSYRTGDGSWSEPAVIDAARGGGTDVTAVAVDGGETLAVWTSYDGGPVQLSARRSASGVWSAPVLVADGDWIWDREAVAIAGGGLVVVWSELDDAFNYSVWARRYIQATGWGPVVRLDERSYPSSPRVAIDGSGNVTAVWLDHDAGELALVTARYEPTTGWKPAVPIAYMPQRSTDLRLVTADDGSASVFWCAEIGAACDLKVSSYR